jgi:hypothetical protein
MKAEQASLTRINPAQTPLQPAVSELSYSKRRRLKARAKISPSAIRLPLQSSSGEMSRI